MGSRSLNLPLSNKKNPMHQCTELFSGWAVINNSQQRVRESNP